MARRSDQDAALKALYDRVPEMNCKGKCAASCGPIDYSGREHTRMREAGVKIQSKQEMFRTGNLDCAALVDGKCAVYDVRPMICRIWGASEAMPCRWGCTPVDGRPLLGAYEAYLLLIEAMEAGGGCVTSRVASREQIDQALAIHGPESFSRVMREYVGKHEDGDYARQEGAVSATLASEDLITRTANAAAAFLASGQRGYTPPKLPRKH